MEKFKNIARKAFYALFVFYTVFRVGALYVMKRVPEIHAQMLAEYPYHNTDAVAICGIFAFVMSRISIIVGVICFVYKKRVLGTVYLIMAIFSLFLLYICNNFDLCYPLIALEESVFGVFF